MPVSTNFNISPYFDDYSTEKDFYKILFRPSVPVQAREFNQLQTILQNQIEKFADNIFQKGTIIDGCNIVFHSVFPYVKIRDTETSGAPANVTQYENLYIKNSANLQGYVVKTIQGYETKNPDLNTLYIRYINSGNTANQTAFSNDQVLTVFDPINPIFKINVENGSSGFSNTDQVVIIPSLLLQNTTGGTIFSNGFYVGDYISNGLGANLQITALSSQDNNLVISLKPIAVNLLSGNTAKWTINSADSIVNANTGQVANVISSVGTGATGTLLTDSVGRISLITVTNNGSGYDVLPYIAISSSSANTAQLGNLVLTPQTYLTQITVANSLSSPVGSGYGLSIDDGVIYQKGYFQRVESQLVVVEKYNNSPNLKIVGFDTTEEIINSNIDRTLLDNALGTPNETAPGANRLKLTPQLVVLDKNLAESNAEFLSIVEFAEGLPFKQNKQTQYNIINQEIAKRTYEESGNYVIDRFNLNTKSPVLFSDEANVFSSIIDPGVAYINGYRVDTVLNYNFNIDKGTDTELANNATISVNYGNYIKIKELGGIFRFSTGDLIKIYAESVGYISTTPGAAIVAPATQIGTARIKSLVLESGTQGTPTAVYRLYLFDVKMNAGKNFKDAKSVFYDGSNKGIADIVLYFDNSITANIALIYDNNKSASVFYTGINATKNSNNISYTYRTIDETRSCNTLGIITKTLGSNEIFPWSGTLNSSTENDIIITPFANIQSTANISGGVSCSTSTANITGTATTFLNDINAGDYIKIANTTANVVGRVISITNNTLLTISSPPASTISGNAVSFYPQFVPISLNTPTRTANVSANGSVLTISLGSNVTATANVSVAYNVKLSNVQPVTKTVNRDSFVRIDLSNNTSNTVGPWCLGVSDIFRLKNVYIGSNNTFLANSVGIVDVTNDFYIDHNQNENYYDTSYLYIKPNAITALANTNSLLIQFDCFTTGSDGLKSLQSYPVNDTILLANSVTTINTVEIPEMYDVKDNYYDLRDQLDFRPTSNNTANVTSNLALVTINPTEPTEGNRFSASDKKYPVPDSVVNLNMEYYLPRKDRVVIDSSGDFRVVKGTPGSNLPAIQPDDSLTINILDVKQYPTLPFALSSEMAKFVDTKVANEKYSYKRLNLYTVATTVNKQERDRLQLKGYTMEDIGKLDKRITDLEYYVTFTLAETLVKNKIIRSSTDDSLDRFKFGFFVDSFEDDTYSDMDNPEYAANKQNGNLICKIDEFNLEFEFNDYENVTGNFASLPFVEHTLVNQNQATDGAVAVTASSTAIVTGYTDVAVSNTVVVQTTAVVDFRNKNTATNKSGLIYEINDFVMSSLSGPVELYLNFRDNKNAIEIYQSTSPITSTAGLVPIRTALNIVSVTWEEIYSKMAGMERVEIPGFVTYQGSVPVAEDGCKLTWTHDSSQGSYYRVVITKYKKSGGADNWRGKFIARLYYPADSTTTVTSIVKVPSQFSYYGTTNISPSSFNIQSGLSYNNNSPVPFFTDAQVFQVSASGLKPNTIHKFNFDNIDVSGKCKQVGRSYGSDLISDASGIIDFQFYYDAGIDEVTSNFEQYNKIAQSAAGTKSYRLSNIDATSTASGSIPVKFYINN